MGGGKGAGEGCVPQTQDQCRGRASVARGQRRTEPGARSRGRTAVPSLGAAAPTLNRGVEWGRGAAALGQRPWRCPSRQGRPEVTTTLRRRLRLQSWLSVPPENQTAGRRSQPAPPRRPGLGPATLHPTGVGARWAPFLPLPSQWSWSSPSRGAQWPPGLGGEQASGGHSSPCLAPSSGIARSCLLAPMRGEERILSLVLGATHPGSRSQLPPVTVQPKVSRPAPRGPGSPGAPLSPAAANRLHKVYKN